MKIDKDVALGVVDPHSEFYVWPIYKRVDVTLGDFRLMAYSGKKFHFGVDKKVQRPIVWDDGTFANFFRSVLMGINLSNIIIVDVQKCLDALQDMKADLDDRAIKDRHHERMMEKGIKYFSATLKKGAKFLILDGQNRSVALHKMWDGHFKINEIILEGADPWISEVKPLEKPAAYQSLPQEYKDLIDNQTISVTVVTQIHPDDMGVLFLAINDGVTVSPQQIRMAYGSAFASEIYDHIGDVDDPTSRVLRLDNDKEAA